MSYLYIYGGSTYYPRGGYHDFLGNAETLEDALRVIANLEDSLDWWHIVKDGEIIEKKKKAE